MTQLDDAIVEAISDCDMHPDRWTPDSEMPKSYVCTTPSECAERCYKDEITAIKDAFRQLVQGAPNPFANLKNGYGFQRPYKNAESMREIILEGI